MKTNLAAIHGTASISRTDRGIPRICANTWEDAFYSLGWVQAHDRGGQIAVTRLAAQGRLCETIRDDPALLELDIYFRRLGFARDAELFKTAAIQSFLDAYCHGINDAWQQHAPSSLRLFGYTPEPFITRDILLLLKLTAFAGLAETQRIVELFIIDSVIRGVELAPLQAIFPALTALNIAAIKQLTSVPHFFPSARNWIGAPLFGGSNNWVLHGSRTQSGKPILCNDPHLEINRLPQMLYEVEMKVDDRWIKGASIPGLPGFLSARTPTLAWGVTYAYADTSDFYIERCQNETYRRNDQWHAFKKRKERIIRKKSRPFELTCYENDIGLLEGNAKNSGDYLCWRWTGQGSSGSAMIHTFIDLITQCKTVDEAQAAICQAEIPTLHIVCADTDNNIGYQFCGHVPKRPASVSGLAPISAWDNPPIWDQYLDRRTECPSEYNPAHGYIVTANDARQLDGHPITTIQAPQFRKQRIEQLLNVDKKFSIDDMKTLQYDVLSLEAQYFTEHYLPYIPVGKSHDILTQWDFCYDQHSLGASLFENIHRSVLVHVFGQQGLDKDWIRYLINETNLYSQLIQAWDNILKCTDSVWLPQTSRQQILQQAVLEGLELPLKPWGKQNQFYLQNIFFGGALPNLLGFDKGPFPLIGNHATVHQGQLVKLGKRQTSSAPCYHFMTDMATNEVWTNSPGGVHESRFSRWYFNDFDNWLTGQYKKY